MNGKPIICPNCQLPNLVCWVSDEQRILCDKCWHRSQIQHQQRRIVFSPVKSGDGIWMTNDDIGFGELRQFIQACIEPGEAPLLKPFLISSWVGIRALVDLLESRMADPLQEPEYLAVMQNIRQLHEYLFRLSHRKEELEKDVSEHQKKMNDNWTDALYASLMEKMHKEHNVERRIEDAQKQLEKIRDRAKSILSNHSSTVQNRTIQRLRRQLLSYTDSGHHLTSSSQIGNEKHVLIGAPVEQMPVIQLPDRKSVV